MKLSKGYGRFAAAVNSLPALLFCVTLSAAMGITVVHAQTAPLKLAVLGDSLAAGYGLHPDEAFPVRLEAALKAAGRDVSLSNQGVSGDTTAGGLDRVDWMLADRPDIVMVELGANDALRGTDPVTTEKNLAAIVEKLKAANVTVWLIGMLAPRNFGPEYAKAFDGLYPRLAEKYQLPFYPFILEGVAQDTTLNQADGLHPNTKGVEVIVKNLLAFATKNLDLYAASVHRPARP
jgi:acyl-CoA thioesterase I